MGAIFRAFATQRRGNQRKKVKVYDELVKMIKEAPATYYVALLGHVVKAAYEKDVFLKSGASTFVEAWERQNGRAAPTPQDGPENVRPTS